MHLYKRPLSRATVSTYVRNIRIFLRYRWLIEYELPFDPQKIKVPKSPKKIVHIYNDTEIKEIFALIHTSLSHGLLLVTVLSIALMLDSGLRQSEICHLLTNNLDRSRMVMKVTGKGAKDRLSHWETLPLHYWMTIFHSVL